MKKHIVSILMISLVLLLTLASCSPNNGSTSVRTVRVIGTAKSVPTRAADQKYVIDSVSEVNVNGVNIVDKLVPADPSAIKPDKLNNVEFKAEIEVPERTSLEAAPAKAEFVFDEWEVLDDEDAAADEALLDKIEDWLESTNQEHKEKIDNIPAEYIPYLVAEYDRGYYVDLSLTGSVGDGSKEKPLSVEALKAKEYDDDELTLVLLGEDTNGNFKALVNHLNTRKGLEELKIKSEKGATVDSLPALTLEETKLSGFTFTAAITLKGSDEFEYEFDGCIFTDVIIDGGEIEINGGKADNVTINAGEVEIEDMEITGLLDLSQMTDGSVELENVKYGDYEKPANDKVEVEIETRK